MKTEELNQIEAILKAMERAANTYSRSCDVVARAIANGTVAKEKVGKVGTDGTLSHRLTVDTGVTDKEDRKVLNGHITVKEVNKDAQRFTGCTYAILAEVLKKAVEAIKAQAPAAPAAPARNSKAAAPAVA